MSDSRPAASVIMQGAYGNGNSGDDAIMLAVIQQLTSQLDVRRLVAISLRPELTQQILGEAVETTLSNWQSWRNIKDNLTLFKSADLFIFGGGGLISEVRKPILVGLLARLFTAKLTRTSSMIYAIGADPIVSWQGKALIRMIAALVDTFTVRDQFSQDCLINAGVPARRVQVTVDPVLGLNPQAPDASIWQQILETERIHLKAGPVLGLAVAHSASQQVYQELQAILISLLQDGWQVLLLPFERFTDIVAVDRLYNSLDYVSGLYVIRNEWKPIELKALVGRLNVLASMRLHPLIFAIDQCVPSIALSFCPKTASIMSRVGQEGKILYLDHMVKQGHTPVLSVEDFMAHARYILANHGTLQAELETKREELRSLAVLNAKLAADLVRTKS